MAHFGRLKMETLNRFQAKSVFVTFIFLLFATSCFGDLSIKWHTVDGGGLQSKGGNFVITGTIGQPDAGYIAGNSLNIEGGYWTFLPHCVVDLELFAKFAMQWLDTGVDLSADLYSDSHVNIFDLQEFADNWLCFCPFDWELR